MRAKGEGVVDIVCVCLFACFFCGEGGFVHGEINTTLRNVAVHIYKVVDDVKKFVSLFVVFTAVLENGLELIEIVYRIGRVLFEKLFQDFFEGNVLIEEEIVGKNSIESDSLGFRARVTPFGQLVAVSENASANFVRVPDVEAVGVEMFNCFLVIVVERLDDDSVNIFSGVVVFGVEI
jgi:hypothetical protein